MENIVLDLKTRFIILLFLPILVSIVAPYINKRKRFFYTVAFGCGLLFLFLILGFPISEAYIEITPLMVFVIDKYSWLYIVVIAIEWLITTIYSMSYVKFHFQEDADKFYSYLFISISVVTLNAAAGNLLVQVFTYILSIPLLYPLLAIKRSVKSQFNANFYIKEALYPAIFILIPLTCWIVQYTGHFQYGTEHFEEIRQSPYVASIMILLFIWGFSKNSVFPFHRWLPMTSDSPTPVNALVNSIIAAQTGALGIIKIVVHVLGIAYVGKLSANFFQTGWILYLLGGTALYTAYKAYKTTHLQNRFAYSTVGQLSYIITAVLIGTPISMMGGLLHIITHSFAKTCLFFIVGVYNSNYGTVKTTDVARMAPYHKWLVVATGIAGLSISGFPLLAGYYSKDFMLLEEYHTGHYAAAIFLLIGSIMNVMYIWPIIKAGFFYKVKQDHVRKSVPRSMSIAIALCILVLLTFSLYLKYVMNVL